MEETATLLVEGQVVNISNHLVFLLRQLNGMECLRSLGWGLIYHVEWLLDGGLTRHLEVHDVGLLKHDRVLVDHELVRLALLGKTGTGLEGRHSLRLSLADKGCVVAIGSVSEEVSLEVDSMDMGGAVVTDSSLWRLVGAQAGGQSLSEGLVCDVGVVTDIRVLSCVGARRFLATGES